MPEAVPPWVVRGNRIAALDAMRGIAAFVVILHHFYMAFGVTQDARWYVLPFVAGHQAVVLFFVLSGYVLSLPFWQRKQLPYSRYILRRVFRIYVPYVAALLLAIGVSSRLLYSQLPLTPWFYTTWHTPLTAKLIAEHLAMSGGAKLNTAFWSLRYEMQMSIIFPGLCWAMYRLGPRNATILGLVTVWWGVAVDSFDLLYGACFIFGAILAWKRGFIKSWYERTPVAVKAFALILIAGSYFSFLDHVTLLGVCGVLIFAQHSRARQWLESAVPVYLGRVSYSLYLTHGTVLFAMLIFLYGKIPTPLLGIAFAVAAMIVAHLFCVLIEEPANEMGKRLTRQQTGPWRFASQPGTQQEIGIQENG